MQKRWWLWSTLCLLGISMLSSSLWAWQNYQWQLGVGQTAEQCWLRSSSFRLTRASCGEEAMRKQPDRSEPEDSQCLSPAGDLVVSLLAVYFLYIIYRYSVEKSYQIRKQQPTGMKQCALSAGHSIECVLVRDLSLHTYFLKLHRGLIWFC